MMTGSLVGSILADRFGRKKCYYLACLFMTTCGIGSGLALDIYTYAIARFLIGLAVGGKKKPAWSSGQYLLSGACFKVKTCYVLLLLF